MSQPITGIHHVTAIATNPQRNLDFYEGTLGLRLVKRTVNFDDSGTYHFYFGDELGRPGTILTFFPWPLVRRGSRGSGQATVTSFSIPRGSLGFWKARLEEHRVLAEDPKSRFGEEVLVFYDPDGLKLELVAGLVGDLVDPWISGAVPPEHVIRGFHSVRLEVQEPAPTVALLTETMGLRAAGEHGNRFRFETAAAAAVAETPIGKYVDVVHTPETGLGVIAAGTVHHVAWRVPDDASQEAWREELSAAGLHPTRVLDRQYFKSIYFREPGGVLFEFATDPPGFTRDEEPAALGEALKLPPWLESEREQIERGLPAISREAPERI